MPKAHDFTGLTTAELQERMSRLEAPRRKGGKVVLFVVGATAGALLIVQGGFGGLPEAGLAAAVIAGLAIGVQPAFDFWLKLQKLHLLGELLATGRPVSLEVLELLYVETGRRGFCHHCGRRQ